MLFCLMSIKWNTTWVLRNMSIPYYSNIICRMSCLYAPSLSFSSTTLRTILQNAGSLFSLWSFSRPNPAEVFLECLQNSLDLFYMSMKSAYILHFKIIKDNVNYFRLLTLNLTHVRVKMLKTLHTDMTNLPASNAHLWNWHFIISFNSFFQKNVQSLNKLGGTISSRPWTHLKARSLFAREVFQQPIEAPSQSLKDNTHLFLFCS